MSTAQPAETSSSPSDAPAARPRLDPTRRVRCLPKGKFTERCVGHIYWTYASVYEPILLGMEDYPDDPLSETIIDSLSWFSDTIASGDPDAHLPTRPAIVSRVYTSQQAGVVCLATFSGRPITEAPSHLQHYAAALSGTSPWPDPTSPIVSLNQPWPISPCYAVMREFSIAPCRVKARYRRAEYSLDGRCIGAMRRILHRKTMELARLSRDEMKQRNAELPKFRLLARIDEVGGSLRSFDSYLDMPTLHERLQSVAERPAEQPAAPQATDAVVSKEPPVKGPATEKGPVVKSSVYEKRKREWAKKNIFKFIQSAF